MVTEAVKPMAGDVAGNDNGAVTDSRSLVDSLVASGALDPLFERIDGGQIELTGDGGLLGELTRVALERGLQAEMTSHLGYAPGDRESKAGGGHANSRNGSYPKTLSTPVGEVCFASMFVRQVRQCFSAVWADGFPRCRHRFPVM